MPKFVRKICHNYVMPILALFLIFGAFPALAERAYTPEDLDRVKSLSTPALSPDGKWIAYVLTESDYDGNKSRGEIYLV